MNGRRLLLRHRREALQLMFITSWGSNYHPFVYVTISTNGPGMDVDLMIAIMYRRP